MNYLVLFRKDGTTQKFPLIKKQQSLPLVVGSITEENYDDFDKVEIVVNGVNMPFKYSTYKKAFDENVKNKVHFSDLCRLVKLKAPKDLEMLRNSIVKSGYTKYCAERYDRNRRLELKRVQPVETFVSFASETVIKKNGKKKVRYFCKPHHGRKQMFRDLKNLLSDSIKLEPEMLGAGKGLIESKKYFDSFDALVKIDFKDFFNQVSYSKFVNGLKTECGEYMSEQLIKTIAMTTCPYSPEKKKRATFQGLPTSTIAAYIALKPLFVAIKEELKKHGTEPVVYIDDLCFKAKDKDEAFKLKKIVLDIIKKHKFLVNKEKCKVLYGNKCFFLGINMRSKSMPKKYVDVVKAGLNNFFHGDDEFRKACKSSIQGKLEYIKYINPDQYKKLDEHPKYGLFISALYNY
ncbi:MAG: reverse transcriptase domain-containing protein [Sarcina sp.]